MQNTQQFNFRLSRTLMALVVISGVALASQAQQFRLTGELRDGVDSQAFAVAANGAVLAGRAEDADFTLRAVRWTPAGGLKALNLPGSTESEAQAISNDGNVIVGGFRDAQERQRAFRWTETGVTDLGTLTSPGAAFATGVSGDGNVVVGWSLNEQGQEQPFRWSAATGMENLGTLGGIRGFAYDANADGAVVVGAARDTSETLRAFRWSRAKGKELVPVSAQGFSEARAITGDGRFIAGNDSAGAFRWNETGSVTRIAPPPRNDSFTAWDISSDGSRLVGLADNEEFSTVASVWTEQTGSVDLNKAFAGVIAGGWTLVEATAISPDGNWIVGIAERGFDRQGFILHAAQIPVPSPEFYFPSMAKSAQETDRSVRLVVSHTNPMPGTYTVHFQTVGGSASAGSDFMATNGVLTFAPGETSKEISITLLNDGQREGDESFQLQLSNASPGMTVASGTATVFIGDNDFGYEAPFFYQVSEADPFIDVTVRRIGDFNMETTLDLIARAEDAVPGVDFVASTNRLVFAPGAQRATARIQLLNDAIRDGSKTLIVVFTNATGGLPAPQTHVMINILDNEEGYTLGDGAHVIEGPGSTLNVYRIGEYSSPAQVRITVTNENFGEPGTATVNQDFTQFVTTVTFAPGQTNATVSIPIKDDHEMERDETFYVLLESLSPSVSAPEHAAVVRLRDNDINPAQVSSVNFTGHLSEILQVSTMADGRFLITGRLDVSIEGFQEFDQVLRLLPDGSVDPTFTPYTTKARLGSMTQAPNGQILVVEHPGLRETRVIRLHENGGVDTFFNPPTSLGSSVIIVAHPNGGVLLSGEGRLIRLLQNGQVDPAFSSPNFTTTEGRDVNLIFPVVTQNGHIFAHGSFDVVNGQARPGIARLTSSGALDTGFAPGVEHLIFVHASADGSVLAYSQENVLRLSPTGRIDATFTAVKGEHFLVTPSGIVHAITHEAVTLGSIQEYTRYWISRHNADGSSTGSAPMTILVDNRSTTLQPRGENEIALFGAFNEVNGQPRASLATVNVSGVTPKILVAAPVWETGGSASVTLVRTGDNSEALTVRYSTADLTARAGVHYEAASGELKFPPNVSTGTVPLRLPDNPTASADTMLNLVFRTPGGIAINESPLTILNDDPGFLVSELFLPDQKTVALRFTGRGTPNLESSKTLEEWLAYERQPSKREILVPDTTRSDMEFFTFTVEE